MQNHLLTRVWRVVEVSGHASLEEAEAALALAVLHSLVGSDRDLRGLAVLSDGSEVCSFSHFWPEEARTLGRVDAHPFPLSSPMSDEFQLVLLQPATATAPCANGFGSLRLESLHDLATGVVVGARLRPAAA